jgi:hypothetical protein
LTPKFSAAFPSAIRRWAVSSMMKKVSMALPVGFSTTVVNSS